MNSPSYTTMPCCSFLYFEYTMPKSWSLGPVMSKDYSTKYCVPSFHIIITLLYVYKSVLYYLLSSHVIYSPHYIPIFMLWFAILWVYTQKSCFESPLIYPRINDQIWYQVSTSFLSSYRYIQEFLNIFLALMLYTNHSTDHSMVWFAMVWDCSTYSCSWGPVMSKPQ